MIIQIIYEHPFCWLYLLLFVVSFKVKFMYSNETNMYLKGVKMNEVTSKQSRNIIIGLIIYFALFFSPPISGIGSMKFSIDFAIILGDFGLYLACTIALLIFTWSLIKEQIAMFREFKVLTVIIYVVVGIIMIHASNILGMFLMSTFSGQIASNNQASLEGVFQLSMVVSILTAISTAILGPFVEEIVFRLCFFKLLEKYHVPKLIILFISSLIFGFMHIFTTMDFSSLPLYTLGGLVYGSLYMKSKNVMIPLIVHTAINTVASIGMLA